METPLPRKRKKRPLIKARLGCGLTAIGIPLFLMFWWWRIGTMPASDIPMPRLPVPNAHNTYVAAGNALKDTKKIEYAIKLYRTSNYIATDINDHSYTLAQKQTLLDENHAVFAKIQTGLRQEYYAPPLRSGNTMVPFYAKFRGMGRLLDLQAQGQEAKGDWNASVNTRLDALQMGTQIQQGASLIGELAGIRIQEIGRWEVWPAIDHLSALQSRKAITRLQTIQTRTMPLTATMQEEEWLGQASLQEVFQRPDWTKAFIISGNCLRGSDSNDASALVYSFPIQEWYEEGRLMLYGKQRIMRNYTNYMDQAREVAKRRYGTHPRYPQEPNDPEKQMVFDIDYQGFCYAKNQVQNDMLLLALCLRAYHLEHDAYPRALSELCPAYLAQLPEDPFAAQGTYGYKLKGSAYVLYSVGPDGKDDGGVPIDDKTKIMQQSSRNLYRYRVQQESKGDIVASINP